MSQMQSVVALCGFEHGGARRRGEQFDVSQAVAEALSRRKLVRLASKPAAIDDPSTAAGKPSSASPAARASAPQTSSESATGETKTRAARKKVEE